MKAYVFQEKYTGSQMYIWHKHNEFQAKDSFASTVINPDNWLFLKIVTI